MLNYVRNIIATLINDPSRVPILIHRELNFYCRRINQLYHQLTQHPDGYDLMERDWDTAIILDSCRFDVFEEQNQLLQGSLKKETAPGSESREFISRSFNGNQFHDTVYVSGNPHTPVLNSRTFYKIYFSEVWDDNKEQVPADQVTEVAIDAHNRHPNKRIIVHYMQPHLPILHPDKQYLNGRIEPTRGQYWPVDTTIGELREGYAANLEYVLTYVQNLVNSIEGKIIITADHGELLGERQAPIPIKGTDHHPKLYIPELLEVPWLTISEGSRREITEETPKDQFDNIDEGTKEGRLAALGYLK